ncbi:MAG: phage Gp37/Gp68 family protein [Desulfobacterales bacterium]|nr:phage Gp37/Gp68 family protein [Desulfobacterales bacterium]
MNKTGIEYLDYTWNITHGCSKESPGCKNCWAERMARRLAAMGSPGYDPDDPFRVTYHEDRLRQPLKLRKHSRIGVSFMGDLFHPLVAVETIRRIFQIIFMTEHTFFILTKRPARMAKVLGMVFEDHTLEEADNVWFGVSAENQEQADRRIPALLELPVPNRWVSVEPMLGPVDIHQYMVCESCLDPLVCWCGDPRIKWVVCGCESGPGARPMSLDWAQSLAGQCGRANTPFMFKQMMQGGKKVSAPKLNGKQYMEMPV